MKKIVTPDTHKRLLRARAVVNRRGAINLDGRNPDTGMLPARATVTNPQRLPGTGGLDLTAAQVSQVIAIFVLYTVSVSCSTYCKLLA